MDLFTLCDNIMYWLGDVTGLGCETACVLFNIYGEYTLVGKVTKGFAVVDSIAKVEVGEDYKPVNDVVIKSILIQED